MFRSTIEVLVDYDSRQIVYSVGDLVHESPTGPRGSTVATDSGDGHHGLAEADYIADEHTATLVQMVRGNLDRGFLVLEQLLVDVAGDIEAGQSLTRFL